MEEVWKDVKGSDTVKVSKDGKLLDTATNELLPTWLDSKGYPIAGDDNYRARSNPFNRMCLHAKSLVYIDPWSKEEKKFQWPEPKEWHDIL